MVKISNWSDDFWLLLLQAYLQKPVGVKPVYSRVMVELGMELHIHPLKLHSMMEAIASQETPMLKRLWHNYDGNQRRLNRAVKVLREMKGFNSGDSFYDGVDVKETFEKDFRPVSARTGFTPAMLILVLRLYFLLTPLTMEKTTSEVVELARLIRQKPEDVVKVLRLYQYCDPYLNRQDAPPKDLLYDACQEIWHRFAAESPDKLETAASELSDYFS